MPWPIDLDDEQDQPGVIMGSWHTPIVSTQEPQIQSSEQQLQRESSQSATKGYRTVYATGESKFSISSNHYFHLLVATI